MEDEYLSHNESQNPSEFKLNMDKWRIEYPHNELQKLVLIQIIYGNNWTFIVKSLLTL